MKKLFLLILPLLAVAFYSCSNNNDDESEEPGKLINQIIEYEDYGIETFTHIYDSQNRVIKIIEEYLYYNDSRIQTFEYEQNKITCKTLGYEGSPSIYTLNNDGYLIKYEWSDFITEYFYNDNGELIKSVGTRSHGKTSTQNYTWLNGNIISIRYTDSSTMETSVRTFTYTTAQNKLNLDINYYQNEGYFCKFKGMTSKNLIQTITHDDNTVDLFSYEFDEDGYPTKVIKVDERGDTFINYIE